MALPTKEELETLETVRNGVPSLVISGNANITTTSLEFLGNGLPIFAIGPSGAVEPPPAYNFAQFMIMF